MIKYSDTLDGWNDEDVNAIVIEKLQVKAMVTNNLPIAVTMTGYPIDVKHQQINGVEIVPTPSVIEAGQTQEITIAISGEVRHLDGVTFEATAIADNPEILTPDMKIIVSDVRATVTGYYEKEL